MDRLCSIEYHEDDGCATLFFGKMRRADSVVVAMLRIVAVTLFVLSRAVFATTYDGAASGYYTDYYAAGAACTAAANAYDSATGYISYCINFHAGAVNNGYVFPNTCWAYGVVSGSGSNSSVTWMQYVYGVGMPPAMYQNKNLGTPACGKSTGDPCDAGSGNEYQAESDYRSVDMALSLTRSYNSRLAEDAGLGFGWILPFHKRLVISGSGVLVHQADGRGQPFWCINNVCTKDADTKLILTQDSSGYTLTYTDHATDRYDTTGKLFSETASTGQTTSYGYDGSGRLSTVTDVFGHNLTFGYDTNNHVATVTDPAGNLINYTYDGNNNLTGVNYPDGTAKRYHYEDPNNPHGLTGISYVDASGVATRFATIGYYYNTNNITDPNNGKAILTQHTQTDNGSPQETFSLIYNSAAQTTITDPVGMQNVMTFVTTNLGVINLTSNANQSDGLSVQQTFDANNNLACRKDEENRVTLYSYNSTNQKLSMTEGLSGTDCNVCIANPATCNVGGVGRVTTYDYLSTTLDLPRFIRRPSVATGQTFETELQYNDTGHPNLPTQVIQRGYTPTGTAVSRTVTLGYNTYGQVNSIDGPRTDVNDVTTLEYYVCTTGGACGQLKKVTNALGHITTYDIYDANGQLKQMTDPNGLKTSYTYDPRGRVKTVTQTPASGLAALTQYSYTPWGDVSQVIDPDGVVLNYQYDAAHYLRYIVDGASNYIYYKYDLKGNRTAENIYNVANSLKRAVTYAYDLRNHLASATSMGNLTQLVQDGVDNLTQEIDGNNHATAHQYDALNRLMKTMDAMNGTGAPTVYGHDVNDHLTSVTAPNNLATQYEHDDLGNLLKEVSPDRKTTTYTHDAAGNMKTVTDARGKITTYTYDALNRVTDTQSSDASTPRYAYTYDVCTVSQLCYVWQDGSTHMIYGYDDLGRRNYVLDSHWLYTMYAYTPGGRLSQITYPDDRTVDYTYDFQGASGAKVGNIVQVSTTAGITIGLAQNLAYHPFGPVKSLTFGNGKTLSASVDQAYRPRSRTDGPYFQNITGYDGADNLTQRYVPGLQSFTYDALNRLGGATDTQSGAYGSLSYAYDGNGNRQSETRNGTVTAYTYNPSGSNWLSKVGTESRLRDAAGNTLWTSRLYGLTYDGYGRLTAVYGPGAAYQYNAFDQRIQKTVDNLTTVFHYGPEGELLYESDNIGARAYVYLNGVPVARVDNGTNIYYYHTDHLGTPQAMTDSAGTTVWKAAYEPFGKATITVSSVPNNLRYDGQYFDQETGLHYNGARYYDPKIGRYISSDPIGLRGGLNTYLYARANPLRYIDPLGLDTTMTCRPVKLFGNLGLSEPVHCSVIVWHWEAGCDGKKRKIIDGQYSLLGGGTSPTTDPNNPTFQDDRNAFNNPGGSNTNYNIPAPPGTSQSDFDRAVMNSGSNYSQGTYMPPGYGPNSNTAANNIIQNAGGTPPNVPGAWGQHYTPQGNPNAVPGIPW